MNAFYGILIPFIGTSLGAACVFFMRKSFGDNVRRGLVGFASGVMTAASVWSLIIPAIEQSEHLGKLSFLPAAAGFWAGVLFLLLLDHIIPHLHNNATQAEGPKSKLQKTTMMLLAVTLHNIPEGMAVGVVYAGYLSGKAEISAAGALALSIGIAIQNFPEGAIISMPLRAEGMKNQKPSSAAFSPARLNLWARCSRFWRLRLWCPPCPICSASPPAPCSMWWWRSLSLKCPTADTPMSAQSFSPWVSA